MKNQSRGITLVALVITIIILLILAGISINALTGSGLFEKAKESKKEYENSANLENGLLTQYEKQINELGGSSLGGQKAEDPIAKIKNTILSTTDNTKLKDLYGNSITIPAGFKVKVDEDTNNVTTVDKGIVIADNNENEFVWIPVPEDGKIYINAERTKYKEIKLNRYTFDENGNPTPQNETAIDGIYEEKQTLLYGGITPAKNITNFKQSVTNNKGYYIGRYEARTGTARSAKTDSLTPITEKGTDSLYNYVTQIQAAGLAQNMYDNTKPFTSDLINSYAWDTATLFLQKCGTNPTYSRKTSVNKKTSENNLLAATGTNNQTIKDVECNIYDMASNIWEWTTETYEHAGRSDTVFRGGSIDNPFDYTSSRTTDNPGDSFSDVRMGFRTLLYFNI